MKKSLALVGLLAVAGLGLGVLSGCHKDEPVDPDPTIVDDDGPQETDHDWVETSHVDATCLEAGSVTYTCSICGETETLEVPALGHEWGDAVAGEDSKWVRVCERCEEVEEFTIGEDGTGIPEDAVLAVTSQTELSGLTALDGVTIALSGTVVEGDESPFEFSSALTIEGSDVTLVVGEGSSVSTAASTSIENSALISVANGASLTLELGEKASLSGHAGQYNNDSGSTERYGVIDVLSGGELVINGAEGSTVTQTYSKAPVLTVEVGGKCTVNGGDFSVTDSSNYTVINDGELTINGGVFSTENDGSSLIISGDDNIGTHQITEAPVLTINGGIFQGGKHIVKNSLEGTLTITGGHFDGYKTEGYVSTDLIDNDTGHTYISGGVFGQELTAEEELEYGSYNVAITAKAPKDTASGFENSVEITGGTFYAGTTGLFDIEESASITISNSVYSEISSLISEGNFDVTQVNDQSAVVVTPKSE